MHRSKHRPRAFAPARLALAVLVGATASHVGTAGALELGFEARVLVQQSDNIGFDNAGLEDEGTLGFGSVGLFGEQRGRRIDAAFSGELDVRRRLDDEDDEWDSISRFLGAAEFRLTPQVLSWYVGNVLGGVLDDTLQPIDGFETRRRNVFVTGPALDLRAGAHGTIDARLLYVNQTEEGDRLETFYSGFAQYRRERVQGRFFGLMASNVFTDASGTADGLDFNRASGSVFGGRGRGPWSIYGEVGATAYTTDDEDVAGTAALARVTRDFGPANSLSLTVSTDLNDQALGTVEGLIADGIGERQDADGIFTETRATLAYGLDGTRLSFDATVGIADIDYELLVDGSASPERVDDQDQTQGFASAVLSRPLGNSLRAELAASYRIERFDNVPDELDSVLGTARLLWRFARSFQLEASYALDRTTGIETRATVADGLGLGDVDRTENRVGLGLVWSPPTRADRELTGELRSLIR